VQDQAIVAEFTHQAESFNTSAAALATATLDDLVELADPRPGERWLEAACGPGIVSRRLAARAGAVHGIDLTAAMIDVARREAAAAKLDNLTFAIGDATALELETASVDGAVARFTIHHLPVPARLVEELARVVRPGGCIVLADHIADDDGAAAAWSGELERLRDPSHWTCLPLERLRHLGRAAGLELEQERLAAFALDFEDWLERGSGGPGARALIERALADPPAAAECFRVREDHGRRALELRLWTARWRR